MTTDRPVRVWYWMLLNLPFGMTSGFVGVMLGYLANQAGMDDAAVASLPAANLFPQFWKFLWAPLADITLSRKKWYVLASIVSCGSLLVMAFVPFTEANLDVFKLLILANSFAITFLGMAVEGLLAHATTEENRGRAAGWFQAGNLGGYGIGGGLALWIAKHVSIEVAFVTLSAILAACMLALLLVPSAPRERFEGTVLGQAGKAIQSVLRDVWQTFASRRGAIALVLCFMPLGAGAASSLLSAIATRWGVAEDSSVVEYTTGLAGGFAAAVGCLAGGWLSDRMSRRWAYALAGVLLAVVAAGMATAPRNAWTYGTFVLIYNFMTGVVYGCFTGFVLEVIGRGAIATKYNALASLSNFPIWYMTLLLGWTSKHHGPVMMLYVEALAGLAGLVVFSAVIAAVRPGKAPPAVS
jgi:MFS family permease